MSITLPIRPVVYPSTLNGVSNGQLPAGILVPIGVPGALMERTAARSFIAMFDEARRTLGVQVRQVGHYRTLQQQINLFVSRYRPTDPGEYTATPADRRKRWDDAPRHGYTSVYWVKKLINGRYPATAATPGRSNHGLGLALDIGEEYDSDTAADPIRSFFVQWLVDNAHRYGISAELQSEPWHWRYVAGDAIPQATLDYESRVGGATVPPTPTTNGTTSGPALVFDYPGTPLRLGSKGDAVKLVQAVVGATPDGDFGAVTERRVKDWQSRNGLLADGVVGPVTWGKMFPR